MPAQVDRALQKAYGVPERWLVLVNCVLAAFVAVSHGGALLVATSKGATELSEIRALTTVSLPVCVILVLTGIAVLLRRAEPQRILRIHAVVFAASAAWLALWSLKLLLSGVAAEDFVWMPGILTACVTYAAILVVRFLVSGLASAYHWPAFAFAAAALIDLGVLARVL